jgi:mono/diheme cytochrome c family protein
MIQLARNALGAFTSVLLLAQVTLSAQQPPTFEDDIAPILKQHCAKCHNPRARKADLDVTSAQGLFIGGESGQLVVPGKLDESLLWEMLHDKLMPPEDEPALKKEQLETVRLWIESGTPFRDKTDPATLLAAGEVNQHDIAPIMLLRCTACHGLRKQEGELDLRSRESMLKGGKSGPAMVLGNPAESLLLKRIHAGEMPPKEKLILAGVKPISEAETEKIRRWIELNAPTIDLQPDIPTSDPDPLVSAEDRQHWSFIPPTEPIVPTPRDRQLVANPIDAFLLQKLNQQRLSYSPEASRATLLRRACFDLTGLPPTAQQVEAFLADGHPLAYERLIEELLASPHYGERWGRFWLDAAGYADSEGKRSADPIRPFAYRYRDYVIRSFNMDKAYSRFLLEQLAGDELADYSDPDKITPEIVDNLIATGFLRMAPDGTGSDVVNRVPERMEVVADELEIFGATVLGLTLKCARCHSHKYDPIPQRDYYRLVDIFKGAMDVHDWLKPVSVQGQSDSDVPSRFLDVITAEERGKIEQHNEQVEASIVTARRPLLDRARELRQEHTAAQLATVPEPIRADLAATLKVEPGERSAIQKYLAEKFEAQLNLTDKQLLENKEYKTFNDEVDAVVKGWESQIKEIPRIRALWDRGEPSPTYVFRRGDHRLWGRLVGPGLPSALTDGQTPFEPSEPWEGSGKTGRRRALAEWLIEPDHPLTSRVMANRIWKHHFGEGIVRSLDNFGKLGTPPSHPELLDWLALRFVESGWSVKQMHRLIMTSQAYRQVSLNTDELMEKDPENILLARMPLRRLDAEEVRDSLIVVSGSLREEPFGRPDQVNVREDGLVIAVSRNDSYRRSIYLRQRRKEMPTFLETFDLPQMNPACQARATSNVAQQALYLMNNTMVRSLADSFARRVSEQTTDPAERIQQIYLSALGRRPSSDELESGQATLLELENAWREELQEQEHSLGKAGEKALATYCHTIFNTAEFLYVD